MTDNNKIDTDLPPKVYRTEGTPGSGKTTRIVGNPNLGIEGLFIENLDKYSFDDQMLITYTNAGVDEAADRLNQMLDIPKYKVEERITTIHSRCFQTLDLNPRQVVRWKHKSNFCDIYDIDFSYDDDDGDIMSSELDEGNSFFRIYGWLKSNRKNLEEWQDCPVEWNSGKSITNLFNNWNEFKSDRDLIQFSDMIENTVALGRKQLSNLGWGILFAGDETPDREMFNVARQDAQRNPEKIRGKGAFPDTKVLYIDECQDLTPLQWDYYLMAKLVCDKVYLGHDIDQTIYEWGGADPRQPLNEEGDLEILNRTYRIPSNILEKCNEIIEPVDDRVDKGAIPDGGGGEFITYERPSGRQLVQHINDDSTVFILFRARYMIDEFTDEVLHPQGIPYDNMSTFDTWDKDTVNLRDALGKLDREEKLTGKDINTLKEFYDGKVSNGNLKDDIMDNMGGWSSDKVRKRFNLSHRNPVRQYINKVDDDEINYYQQQAILGNIGNDNHHMYPNRVKIGTIHSAKGKEAETVILATDSTKRILSNMSEDVMGTDKYINDAERRVYYVGATRASEKLVIAEGVIDDMHSIPLKHLLKEYTPEYGTNKQLSEY